MSVKREITSIDTGGEGILVKEGFGVKTSDGPMTSRNYIYKDKMTMQLAYDIFN